MGTVVSLYGNRDPREVPLYTVTDAARYLRVPLSTLHAWTRGQITPAGRIKPVVQAPDDPTRRLTFNNLVEAYVIASMRRDHDLPLAIIRSAIGNVERMLNTPRPLLSERFATDGVKLYLDAVDHLIEVSTGRGNQLAMRAAVAGLQRIEADERGLAQRLFPYSNKPTEKRFVTIDPRVSFGRPTVIDSGTPVAVLSDLHAAGESAATLAKEFGLPKQAIQGALAWHQRAAG
jgi:uncharacterized protein (DUF433 family)